jgi:DNA-binding LacI/PurR family transcriptional regulator
MKKRNVTSHDVARRAGVSQSTVSLVLNGHHGRISETTRQRVLEAARELNFSLNVTARALVTGRTQRIGLVPISPHVFHGWTGYYIEILAGVMQGMESTEYNLLTHSASYPDWCALYSDIISGASDGVLLVGRSASDPLTRRLQEHRFPTVCISSHPREGICYAVDCDNEAGGCMAVEHLLKLGHRRIAILQFPGEETWQQERAEGARRALREAGMAEDSLVMMTPKDLACKSLFPPPSEWIAPLARFLRESSPRITALILEDETRARLFAEALPEYGMRVPDDLAMVSFDSTEVSERTNPPLTAVYQPLREIGKTAAKMLIALIEGKEVTPGIRRFPMRLDVRHSCGARALSHRESR